MFYPKNTFLTSIMCSVCKELQLETYFQLKKVWNVVRRQLGVFFGCLKCAFVRSKFQHSVEETFILTVNYLTSVFFRLSSDAPSYCLRQKQFTVGKTPRHCGQCNRWRLGIYIPSENPRSRK